MIVAVQRILRYNDYMQSKAVDIPLQAYPSAKELIEAEAGRIFLALEDKTSYEVGIMFGLDRYYTAASSVKNTIMKAYNMVLSDLAKYDIDPVKAAIVQTKVSARNLAKQNSEGATLRERTEIEKFDLKEQVTGTRDLALKLVRKKLEHLDKSPKALKEEKTKDLAWIAGLLVDKGQIVQGQATENIAIHSKIDSNMSPEDAMRAMLALRDSFQEEHGRQS